VSAAVVRAIPGRNVSWRLFVIVDGQCATVRAMTEVIRHERHDEHERRR
jgi:hypothetical protein